MGTVDQRSNGPLIDPIPEAGPACARIEFRGRAEQLGSAAQAVVRAFALVVPVRTCKRPFGASLAGDPELFWGEATPPCLLLPWMGKATGQPAG